MLLSMPTKEMMMKKCMQLTEDLDKDDRNLVHPSRLINCVVSIKEELNFNLVQKNYAQFFFFRLVPILEGKMNLWQLEGLGVHH